MYLRIELLSDTAFGRGDGVMGIVDSEIEYDKTNGLPIIKGRTLKGLFVEACADVLYGLKVCQSSAYATFNDIAQTLFGSPGSDLISTGVLHFGTATLPADFIVKVEQANHNPADVLEAFTIIRRQTAIDETTDAPKDTSLRALRVVSRGTIFYSHLSHPSLTEIEIALLWACTNTTRQAGQNRTRGLGRIQIELLYDNNQPVMGDKFSQLVKGVSA